jgi:hypothetical protein
MSRIGFCSDSNEFTQRLLDEIDAIIAREHFVSHGNVPRREDAPNHDRSDILVQLVLHIVVLFCWKTYLLQYFSKYDRGQMSVLRFIWPGRKRGGREIHVGSSRVVANRGLFRDLQLDRLLMMMSSGCLCLYMQPLHQRPAERSQINQALAASRAGRSLGRLRLRVFVIPLLSRIWLRVFPLLLLDRHPLSEEKTRNGI